MGCSGIGGECINTSKKLIIMKITVTLIRPNSNSNYIYRRNLAAFGARARVSMLMITIIIKRTDIIMNEFKFRLQLSQKSRSVWRESARFNVNDNDNHKQRNNHDKD